MMVVSEIFIYTAVSLYLLVETINAATKIFSTYQEYVRSKDAQRERN